MSTNSDKKEDSPITSTEDDEIRSDESVTPNNTESTEDKLDNDVHLKCSLKETQSPNLKQKAHNY